MTAADTLVARLRERANEILSMYEDTLTGGGYEHAGDMWRDMKPLAEDAREAADALEQSEREYARAGEEWAEQTGALIARAEQAEREREAVSAPQPVIVTCRHCSGTGSVQDVSKWPPVAPCPGCKGAGAHWVAPTGEPQP